jgi:hypothetical protein
MSREINNVGGAGSPEFQDRMRIAMKRGFQTRDGEMDLARMLVELDDHGPTA